MQANGRQPQRAPYAAPVQYWRHCPYQPTLYRLARQKAVTFLAQAEDDDGADQTLRAAGGVAACGQSAGQGWSMAAKAFLYAQAKLIPCPIAVKCKDLQFLEHQAQP